MGLRGGLETIKNSKSSEDIESLNDKTVEIETKRIMIVTSLTIERRTTVEDTVVRYLISFTTSHVNKKRGGGIEESLRTNFFWSNDMLKKMADYDEQGTVV